MSINNSSSTTLIIHSPKKLSIFHNIVNKSAQGQKPILKAICFLVIFWQRKEECAPHCPPTIKNVSRSGFNIGIGSLWEIPPIEILGKASYVAQEWAGVPALVSLIATIDFIGFWLQALEHNFLELCNMYCFDMKNMFQKVPVELPKPPSLK